MSAGDSGAKREPSFDGDTGVPIPWPNNGQQPSLTPSNYFIPTSVPVTSAAQSALFTTQSQQKSSDQHQGQNRGLLDGLNKTGNKPQSSVYKANPGYYGFPRNQAPMDLHDTTGSILTPFGNTTETEVPGVGQSVGQTVPHPLPQSSAALNNQQLGQTLNVSQSMPQQVVQNGPQVLHSTVAEGNQQSVRVQTSTGAPATANVPVTSQTQALPEVSKELRKATRMPGTKQCPTCQGTIAAAVAKCPKCDHVFRPKKDKPKRSGKRGKKNCPKCQYENPSACSSCKQCKYVFRLKLMDRYKQMRPRTNENVATAGSAAVAHVASMGHSQAQPPQAISSTTLPMPSGVQQYTQISQPMHPQHPAIPPMPQHGMSMHHVAQHNVHQQNVQGLHPLPQHQLHPHQQHPPL